VLEPPGLLVGIAAHHLDQRFLRAFGGEFVVIRARGGEGACHQGGSRDGKQHEQREVTHVPTSYAMISPIGLPWSISRRLRPGISSWRESSPRSWTMVACTSVT